jgi:hypothetical protein
MREAVAQEARHLAIVGQALERDRVLLAVPPQRVARERERDLDAHRLRRQRREW